MMSEKIKACPYCPVPTVTMVFNPDGDDAFVECSRCKTQGPSGKNEAEAIAKWNAAANALEQKDAEIARLTAACDDLEGEYLRMKDERDEAKAEIAEHRNHVAKIMQRENNVMKENERLRAEINKLRDNLSALDFLANAMQQQRDEARKVARRLYRDSQLKDGDIIRLCEELATRNEARKVAKHWYKTAQEYKKEFGSLPEDDDDVLIDFAKSKEYYIATYTRTEPQSIRVTATSDDDN